MISRMRRRSRSRRVRPRGQKKSQANVDNILPQFVYSRCSSVPAHGEEEVVEQGEEEKKE